MCFNSTNIWTLYSSFNHLYRQTLSTMIVCVDMDQTEDFLEDEILGVKIKLSTQGEGITSPAQALSEVRTRVNKILEKQPQLERSQAAILAALELAYENLSLKDEYRENIDVLESPAREALELIEDISPSSH